MRSLASCQAGPFGFDWILFVDIEIYMIGENHKVLIVLFFFRDSTVTVAVRKLQLKGSSPIQTIKYGTCYSIFSHFNYSDTI